MIARIWHGKTALNDAEACFTYMKETGIPDYRNTQGNQGVFVFRRTEGQEVHLLILTLWHSEESIQAFTGPDIEKARYYPEDEKLLLELEPKVSHYEVLYQSSTRV